MRKGAIPPNGPRGALPFRGLRFTDPVAAASRTFVPPQSWAAFSDIDEDELDEHHVLRLLEPVLGRGGSVENIGRVADRLEEWTSTGHLTVDDDPCMYVYRRTSNDHVLLGVIASVPLDAGGANMLRHERVLDQVVDLQRRLERGTRTQLEPIVGICGVGASPDSPTLHDAVRPVLDHQPAYDFRDDGVLHQMWVVSDPSVHRAVTMIAGDTPVLIADGHLRLAAWSSSADGSDPGDRHILTMLVHAADEGLRLGPVHRVVGGVSLDDAVAWADVEPGPVTGATQARDYLATGPPGRCVLAAGDTFVAATPAPGRAPDCAVPTSAVCWLHEVWLARWNSSPGDVEYVHDLATAAALAEERKGTAVLLPAPDLSAVLDAAMRGAPLPHKATSFGPKPRVGLVMRRLAGS